MLYVTAFRYTIAVFITVIGILILIKELNVINICVTETKYHF